jgi:uncharacterized protein YqgC (DUF456 family)
MEIVWWIIVGLLLVYGFLGCFINKVPGPVGVVLAMLIGMTALDIDAGWGNFAVVTVLSIVSIVLSKVLVKLVKKMHEFSKRGSRGTTWGSIIGLLLISCGADAEAWVILLLAVIGLVVLPFTLSFLLELTNKNGAAVALKAATSATCAYLADTCLKLVVFVYAVYVMFFGC